MSPSQQWPWEKELPHCKKLYRGHQREREERHVEMLETSVIGICSNMSVHVHDACAIYGCPTFCDDDAHWEFMHWKVGSSSSNVSLFEEVIRTGKQKGNCLTAKTMICQNNDLPKILKKLFGGFQTASINYAEE
jgi:hypothetical protein